MSTTSDTAGTVRKARVADRDQLLGLINHAFTPEGKPLRDFRAEMPYLFLDQRVGDHFVYERDGRLIGCTGLYPFDVTVAGVTFRGGGVGQVATAAEARGQGVMSTLLEAVCAAADHLDFAWLFGDRLRYGRYGWTRGGEAMLYQAFDKYLPEPADSSQVRTIDMQAEFAFVREKLLALDGFPRLTDEELRLLLSSHGYAGRRLGGSYIITSREGDHVHCAGGEPDELAQLMGFQARQIKRDSSDQRWRLYVTCPRTASAAMTVCLRHYWNVSSEPSAAFRAGDLVSLLGKACRLAQPRVTSGSGRLSLLNSENGAGVTVMCADGRLSVASGASEPSHRLTTAQLSELLFGLCPAESFLGPSITSSPLRTLFPCGVFVSRLVGL